MNKTTKVISALVAIGSLLLLSGCAKYKALPLPQLVQQKNKTGVSLAYKAFDVAECKKYLGRDILKNGYQPVQITIINATEETYQTSPTSLSMPIANADLVTESAHTNTTGRAVGYGTAAVLSCGLFAIPAIVDGIGSSKANEQLDIDYSKKVLNLSSIIKPHTVLNGIVFVPLSDYSDNFTFTITNTHSNKELVLSSTSEITNIK